MRIVLEYDGSGFEGFQRQKTARTVQREVESALSRMTGSAMTIAGAGRTDAGVHATGQVANFRLGREFPLERVMSALNRSLPPDIVCVASDEVSDEFHARHSAKSRTYVYTIRNSAEPHALDHRFVWHVAETLDVEAMAEAAGWAVGVHDFSAFGTPEKGCSPRRDLLQFRLERDAEMLRVTCQANAFLRHMARGLVGGLVEVGLMRREPEDFRRALEGGAVAPLFPVAPPNGLCLVNVEY